MDCWMEIQQGKGPWASPVTGIVPLGTTLTMVVGIDDKEGTKTDRDNHYKFMGSKKITRGSLAILWWPGPLLRDQADCFS